MTANPFAHNVVPIAAKPTTSYVPVTPALATRWLQSNVVNRSIRKAKIHQFAGDMVSGRWTLSNDAICFAVDGKLLNGQHRLSAVVRSGATVVMLVARNVPAESMTNMDSGTARTASDAFGFQGEKNTALLAATAKLCLVVHDGRVYKDSAVQAVSPGELIEFVDDHPEIRNSVSFVTGLRKSVDAPPSAIACAHWLISGVASVDFADYYLSQLASRDNEPAGSAVLAVDSRLREVRRARANYPRRNYLYLLVKGWNHYARGASVRTLAMSPKGEFRLPEPVRWQR